MYVFRFPFVFGLLRSGGVAYGDNGERDDIFRHSEMFPYTIDTFGVGIYAGPHGTESECMGGEEQVFGRSRYVLYPETAVGILSVDRLAEVTAHYDSERCL